jgi:hypothetical protein
MIQLQVGFVVRLEGGRLSEDLADFLPDYKYAVPQPYVCTPQDYRCTATCSMDQVHLTSRGPS